MKRFVFSLVTCLSLLGTTAWLVAHPVLAASITVQCGKGTITCSGSSCSGQDSGVSGAGWCTCTSSTGNPDHKTCSDGDLLD